jgi:uncharacterized Zn-binding protein involved in type VI secretion
MGVDGSKGGGGSGVVRFRAYPEEAGSTPDIDVSDGKITGKVGFAPLVEHEGAGALWTTKKTAEDKSFISTGHAEGTFEALGASYDIQERKAELDVIKASGRVSAVHTEFDAVDEVKKLFGYRDPPPAPPPAPPPVGGPLVAARVGDPTSHGSALLPGIGSPDVFIGGMPAWRAHIDTLMCPVVKAAVPDASGSVQSGAPSVTINGMMACRVGDIVVETPGGPNAIVGGCSTVTIGQPASCAAPSTGDAPSDDPEALPAVKGDLFVTGDVVTVEGEVALGANVDLRKRSGVVEARAGASAALVSGDVQGDIQFKIPFTDHYLSVGAKAEGSAVAIGAEAHANMVVNGVDPRTRKRVMFHYDAGAKLEALVGAGIGFSLTVE